MTEPNRAWDAFLARGLVAQRLVDNVPLDTRLLRIGTQSLPVTVNLNGQASTSWVASLRNSYGPYARAETLIVPMPRSSQWLYRAASVFAESLFALSGLSGGLFLNNWLLATNLYSTRFDLETIVAAREQLSHDYPDSPLIVRSLTAELHAPLLEALVREGFHLIPTRQVWLTGPLTSGDWRKHGDAKKDIALEARCASSSEWVSGHTFSDRDFTQALDLYNALYREKYPQHNPAYNESFFRIAVATGWLSLFGLRQQDQSLSGMVGIVARDKVFATPVLGYDLSADKRLGLYRRLMLKAFTTVETAGGILHCSAGAGSFKKQRGAHFAVEFAAVSGKNLPCYRRAALNSVTTMLWKLAVPYLQRNVL